MAIDITNDNRTAVMALERAKAFCQKIRRKKPVYSVHVNGVVMCSTCKEDIDEYVRSLAPKGRKVREVKVLPLERVDKMRKSKSLGEIITELGLDVTVNSLKVALINAGYIKTNSQISEEKKKRNAKIRRLHERGFTYTMIKEELSLDIKESTIERICRNWD